MSLGTRSEQGPQENAAHHERQDQQRAREPSHTGRDATPGGMETGLRAGASGVGPWPVRLETRRRGKGD
ncbi:hypothetical protein ACQUSR_05580 [Streptomyces sp. P1-3]|uniref:hypothetical protein n=1 Tax=Streptomyces sp. P1-3 TaxID=3421658 RepID=UPI003D3672F0